MAVYVDMVADLFHPGHVQFLRQVRHLFPDQPLYVGVMGDGDAERYKRRPILTLKERVTMLESCRYVDRVFPDAPMPITREFIVNNEIAHVVHGDDISDASRDYWYGEAAKMSIYRQVPYTKGVSTTSIIDRVVDSCREQVDSDSSCCD